MDLRRDLAAVPLALCTHNVLSYKIQDAGQIEVLVGTDNPFNAYRSFPSRLTAYAALRVEEKGTPYPADFQAGNFVQDPYWTPVSEGYTIGWTGQKLWWMCEWD